MLIPPKLLDEFLSFIKSRKQAGLRPLIVQKIAGGSDVISSDYLVRVFQYCFIIIMLFDLPLIGLQEY